MAKVRLSVGSLACTVCGAQARIAVNRPHSLHRTKRLVRPNLQKSGQQLVCTRCRRTRLKQTTGRL
ncbi:50S ribosomal protein L28 [Candidatus Berkelbacteria bacterium]|nr:50S ribosomal protein L28 [Candidatus Berkelbacteria bacterium]